MSGFAYIWVQIVFPAMKTDTMNDEAKPEDGPQKELSDAAKRALAEAKERRQALAEEQNAARPKELNGRDGPEATRYGDWEKNGIISDF